MIVCNVVVPQIFWFKTARTNIARMWVASILVNIGMWCERFVIIVISLHRDFLPASWGMYAPTWVDIIFVGTICFFSPLFLLFLKFVPSVAVSEVKELNHELQHPGVAVRGGPMSTGPRRRAAPTAGAVPHRRGAGQGLPPGAREGVTDVDFYSPYPLPGSDEVLRLKRSPVPRWHSPAPSPGVRRDGTDGVDERRQLAPQRRRPAAHRPPTWIPITFETTVLLDLAASSSGC